MQFVQARPFERAVGRIWSDEEYAAFCVYLAQHPDAGAVIQGTGGARKVRWRASGRGKRGGARVVYYVVTADEQILLITIYTKAEQDDLSPDARRAIRALIQEIKNG